MADMMMQMMRMRAAANSATGPIADLRNALRDAGIDFNTDDAYTRVPIVEGRLQMGIQQMGAFGGSLGRMAGGAFAETILQDGNNELTYIYELGYEDVCRFSDPAEVVAEIQRLKAAVEADPNLLP